MSLNLYPSLVRAPGDLLSCSRDPELVIHCPAFLESRNVFLEGKGPYSERRRHDPTLPTV